MYTQKEIDKMREYHSNNDLFCEVLDELERLYPLETSTYCAYCGEKCELDDNAATRISEHIKVCEKHPIHNYKNMIERLVNVLEFWSNLEDYVPGEWEHEERRELINRANALVGNII
jgi:hypothetical protein